MFCKTFASFTLLDSDHHALAIDVRDLEHSDLGRAQARAIRDAQCSLVFGASGGREQPRHLIRAQDHWQFLGLRDEWDMVSNVVPS
jgi:hypothetical protein